MEQIYFSTNNIMWVVWLCAGVALLCGAWLLWAVRGRIRLCVRAAGRQDDGPRCQEGVSVIVYADDAPERLGNLLTRIFSQRYEGKTEVIVVNDGASPDVADVVKRLSQEHPNLYQTFVPNEAHNLSRRKLGLSLGIKAARQPYVVITCDRCIPESDDWLDAMTRPFARGKEVVLGFARMEGLEKGADRFDEVATAVVWLTAALGGKPYRGTGLNIGYKRSLFFEAKGFSRYLTLHNGDDDLFVNQIATGENSEAVLCGESRMRAEFPDAEKSFRDMRMNHCFTGRFLPSGSRRFFGSATVALWVWLAAVVTGIVFSLPNALPACVFLAMVPAVTVPMAMAWSGAGKALGVRLSPWTAGWRMWWRWIRNRRFGMMCGLDSRKNYTWV